MGKSIVSIVKVDSDDIYGTLEKAVELAGGIGIKKGDFVVIKPNVKNQSPPGYGIVTDPRIVKALVQLSINKGVKKLKIAEGAAYPTGAYDTMAAFEASGRTSIAKEFGVEIPS